MQDNGNKKPKQRSLKQNDSLHLYFEQLAETLNGAGLDMRKVLKPEVEIPWTKENIKKYIWKPIQHVYLNKKSTTELTTIEIDKVYEVLNRHIAKFGIHVPFPCIEQLENDYPN